MATDTFGYSRGSLIVSSGMSRRMWRYASAAAGFVVVPVLALLPATAAGTTHVGVFEPRQQPGVAVTTVNGGQRDNSVSVDRARHGKAVVISDRRFVTAPKCDRLAPTRVVCPSRASDLVTANRIDLMGGDGNDVLALGRSLALTFRAYMTGNKGADRLVGGSDEDLLIGNRGNDKLFGRGGNDTLDGESANFIYHEHPGRDLMSGGPGDDDLGLRYEVGADRYLGGKGRDLLRAHDSERDRTLDAGLGVDRCWFDKFDSWPTHCEKAERIKLANPPQIGVTQPPN